MKKILKLVKNIIEFEISISIIIVLMMLFMSVLINMSMEGNNNFGIINLNDIGDVKDIILTKNYDNINIKIYNYELDNDEMLVLDRNMLFKDFVFYIYIVSMCFINVITFIGYLVYYIYKIKNYIKYSANDSLKVYDEFKTPTYNIILRLALLKNTVNIVTISKLLKENINSNNLIYQDIDITDSLVKEIYEYDLNNFETDAERLNSMNTIKSKIKSKLKEEGFLREILVKDLIIKIVIIFIVLEILSMINKIYSGVALLFIVGYFIKKMMSLPLTEKGISERNKLVTYNEVYKRKN